MHLRSGQFPAGRQLTGQGLCVFVKPLGQRGSTLNLRNAHRFDPHLRLGEEPTLSEKQGSGHYAREDNDTKDDFPVHLRCLPPCEKPFWDHVDDVPGLGFVFDERFAEFLFQKSAFDLSSKEVK